MRSFTLKNIPDDLYERLRQQAAEQRRSLNSEMLVCLQRALQRLPVPPVESVLAEADRVRAWTATSPISPEELRAAIQEGRR